MEFSGVGIVSYDPPSEELRPFVRMKIKTWVQSWTGNIDGYISRSSYLKEVADYLEMFPEERREAIAKDRIAMWDSIIMCDNPREEVAEENIVEEYLERIFSLEQRKLFMERHKVTTEMFFEQIDLNKDGVIDFEEYVKGSRTLKEETIRILFDVIDRNKDGYIQLEEFQYAVIYFIFSSGPDSPLSDLFGPVIQIYKDN